MNESKERKTRKKEREKEREREREKGRKRERKKEKMIYPSSRVHDSHLTDVEAEAEGGEETKTWRLEGRRAGGG